MDLSAYFEPGDRVFVAGSSNEPRALLESLAANPLPERLHFVQFPIAGYNEVDFTAWQPSFELTTFFMSPTLRAADAARLHFVPIQMRNVYDYVAAHTDVALIQVAEDHEGLLRLGPNADFAEAALAGARVVLAERNRAFRAAAGSPAVDAGRLSAVIDSDTPLVEVPAAPVDAVSQAIGEHVAGLVRDGDCLQTGIGAIPAAILAALGEHNDLGMHGGLIDDGGMALIERGVINGSAKAIDRSVHITGMALGSAALHGWLAGRADVQFRGACYTHEVSVMRQLDNFVSVNSAVEVDLFGQVNGEYAGGRQISGTGGSVDFMRGARASRGGRSIVAMPATARGGAVSRIVPKVELVTAARTDVDMVVTEFGVADLRDQPVTARVERLIGISAPAFREALREQAHTSR